jgi:type VI secretion system protein ImpH
MAGAYGNSTESVELLREIKLEPYRYGFFQAVRRINCNFSDMAQTGTAFRPSEDPVRFTQVPFTNFAPSTLNSLDFKGPRGVARLSQRFIGLFGPDGPLPMHLTEYARDRLRHHQDSSFAGFADMFHHRIVSLFYRAWAQAQPTVQHDRLEQDRFSVYVASLAGLGMPALTGLDAMPHHAKLHFAGHLSSLPRHATGLASLLESFFGVKARIREFIAHWLDIPKANRLKLGSDPGMGQLGENTVIGDRVWQRQDKFRVCLGPLSLVEYEAFLPGGEYSESVTAAVRGYLGLEFMWETQLLLKGSERPVTCLGKQGALGWTSWLQSEEQREVIDDLVLQAAVYRS